MNVQAKKGILFTVLGIIALVTIITVSANAILQVMWLASQDVVHSIIKLLLVRWLSIPLFAMVMTLISFLHLMSASKKERKNKKFFAFKTSAIFIFALVCEYYLQISQVLLNFVLGGFTGIIDPLTKLDMSFFLFGIPLLKKISLFIILFNSLLLFLRTPFFDKKIPLHFLDKLLLIKTVFFTAILLSILKFQNIHASSSEYIGYIDVFGYFIPLAISLIFIFLFFTRAILFSFKKKRNFVIQSGILLFLLAMLNFAWPVYLEKFIYTPNQSTLQEQFAGIHAESTRKSFMLDQIVRGDDYVITEKEISNVLAKNFWQDAPHFLQVVQRNQEVLPIFTINSASPILLSNEKGEFSPYLIASRESTEDPEELWDIKHFRNIFGYGAVIGSVNKFNKEGDSHLILKDLELNNIDVDIKLTNPQIFFSETYDDYIFVNTKMLLPNFKKEKAPLEVQNFSGLRSIPTNLFTRILLAIIYRDSRFLLTDYFNKDTRFIFRRKPTEILQNILPNFNYSEPRLTIHNEELWWEMDVYAVSESIYTSKMVTTPWGEYNWVRSPMKAFVSAYSGEVVFDILDETDPFIKITKKLYPRLFERKMGLSADKYLYPIDLFQVQSELLQLYHDTNAASFYSGFNKREIAIEKNQEIKDAVKNRMILDKNIIAMQQTYTPKGKNIFSAQIIAYIDSDKQKKIYLYEAPASLGIPGLKQAVSFLNQDPNFSRMSTLWGQIGSKLSSSDTVFYPMKDRGIYASTIFLESETISTPLAAQFTVIDGTTISLGDTIDELMYNTLRLLGSKDKVTLTEEQQLRSLLKDVYQYYLSAEKARMDGNTQEYQDNVDKIGVALQSVKGSL